MMIVVDSSVWIANLRNEETDAVRKLRAILEEKDILVGDLILLEVLLGTHDERHASRVERDMRTFEVTPMLNDELVVRAAKNYRLLRWRGITVRKTIDLIIGTFCIEHGHQLLHQDRDFDPMVQHLGLCAL